MSDPKDGTFSGIKPKMITCPGDGEKGQVQDWDQQPNHYTGYTNDHDEDDGGRGQ